MRRSSLFAALAALCLWLCISGCSPEQQQPDAAQRALKQTAPAKNVKRSTGVATKANFSDRPVTIKLKNTNTAFVIPANYFLPYRDPNEPDEKVLGGFGFSLFLPDYSGYIPEDGPDYPTRGARSADGIHVLAVSRPAEFVIKDGKKMPAPPEKVLDAETVFSNRTEFSKNLEVIHELDGMTCYGHRDVTEKRSKTNLPCIGTRSNGEKIFMSLDDPASYGGICDVIYFSKRKGFSINYRYHRKHFDRWREIDDAIWEKLERWQVQQ